jgi:hypothetical protein
MGTIGLTLQQDKLLDIWKSFSPSEKKFALSIYRQGKSQGLGFDLVGLFEAVAPIVESVSTAVTASNAPRQSQSAPAIGLTDIQGFLKQQQNQLLILGGFGIVAFILLRKKRGR